MSKPPVVSRQEARRRAIVAAARQAFLQSGYGQTTMSGIAAAVGGSKTTLWSYYRNKQDLFVAVVDDMVERYGDALRLELPADGDPAQTLTMLGVSILSTILRPQIVAMHRMVMGEAGRFPELGRLLFERGARRGQLRTAEWLGGQMDAGTLRREDPLVAAQQFVALCQSGSYQMHLWGAGPKPRLEDIRREVEGAVATFMRSYRA